MDPKFEIVDESLRIFEQSTIPAIEFKARYNLREDMLPLGIKGSVFSEDNKFLTNLTKLPSVDLMNNSGVRSGQNSGEESKIGYVSEEPTTITIHTSHLMFALDKRALDYIEERRHKTKNQDVSLIFYLTLNVLIPSVRVGEFRPHSISSSPDIQVIRLSPGSRGGADLNSNLLVLVDPENIKNRLFKEEIIELKWTHKIPSSDWVYNFQEKLGMGKFLVVEIPLLTADVNHIEDANLNPAQKELKNRLLKAFELINDVQKDIREGEWGEAVKGCRDAIEPFSRGMLRPLIKEIFVSTTGIEEEHATNLTTAFDNLFGYSSGLHHQLTKDAKSIAGHYKGGKEDAYLNYMITTGIINTIARKFILYMKYQK
jgi:hypothetical protein